MYDQKFIETIDTFKIIFGGDNSIDAALFLQTMNNTIDLVKKSAVAIDPHCFLRLEIKATQTGSFETIIDAVARHIPDLLNKDREYLNKQ